MPNNYAHLQDYYAFPNLSSARIWINSSEQPSIALKLYNPSSIRGKMIKYFYSAVPTLIAHQLLHKARPSFTTTINALLSKYVINDKFTASYYLATDGGEKKLTAQICVNNTIHSYAKISSDDKYNDYLKQEYSALNYLAKFPAICKHIPSLLFAHEYDNFYIVCQSAPQPLPAPRTSSLTNADATFLSILAKNNMLHVHLHAVLDAYDKRFGINTSVKQLTKLRAWLLSLDNIEISHTLTHGDYTPWNTYIINDSIYAYDWECFMKEAPALYDAMHFIYMQEWLVKHNNPADTLRLLNDIIDNTILKELVAICGVTNTNISIYIGLFIYAHCYWKLVTSSHVPEYACNFIDAFLDKYTSNKAI